MNFENLTDEEFGFIDDALQALAEGYFENDSYEYAVKVEDLRLRILGVDPSRNFYANLKGE